MSRTFQAVRVMEENAPPEPPPILTPAALEEATADLTEAPEALIRRFDDVQREMDALRAEINLLRRRDETLNFYMHRLDEELRLAARLQQDFLPKKLPELGNVRFHTLYRPAGYVSGDLYDVMRLDEKHVGFYIADAVGHGMPAALLTMFIKHALMTKDIMETGYRLLRPGEALARLNDAILEQNLSQATFATALYGMIDVSTLQVTLSCAGHPAPALLGRSGPLEFIETLGSLLGVFPDEQYADVTVQLTAGDRLLLYTDGVEVAWNDDPATGDPDRWREEFLNRRHFPGDQLLREVAESADRSNGSVEPKDDLTMVLLECGKPL